MLREDRMELLEALASSKDPWDTLWRTVETPPEGILPAVRERFVHAARQERRLLIHLVEQLRVPGAKELLAEWLPAAGSDDAADILRAFNHRGAPVDRKELVRLLTLPDGSVREAAVAAAGACGDASIASFVAPHLDDPRLAMHAAIALGRLRARGYTSDLLCRLPAVRGLTRTGFLVALELMGDESAVGPLLEWLAGAPADDAWDTHHALARLLGREPVVPLVRDRDHLASAVREAWAGFDASRPAEPRFDRIEVRGGSEIEFELHGSSGRIRVDYDAPPPGSSWPRWSKSLSIGDQRIYDVGSACGTCETCLQLVGWSDDRAASGAGDVRQALADVTSVSRELLEALRPLITALQPGHYIVALVDLDLELVSHPASSWWCRRGELRRGEDGEVDPDVRGYWPGTAHFQLRHPILASPPTFGVLLPSQDLGRLSSGVVEKHETAIRGGAHPACIALSWIEDKMVELEHPERFLVGVVLDGHHKLAAYARLRTPARALLVCRIEDTWGPPADPARWFREATAAIAQRLELA
jgi:hypothetical protein